MPSSKMTSFVDLPGRQLFRLISEGSTSFNKRYRQERGAHTGIPINERRSVGSLLWLDDR
jgi:hypothetical protein